MLCGEVHMQGKTELHQFSERELTLSQETDAVIYTGGENIISTSILT